MIVVKIELWRRGSEADCTELGRMYIANDGSIREPDRGNYDAAVVRKGTIKNPLVGQAKAARVGRVENYPKTSYNVWRLISRCIRSAFPEEKE